MWFKPTYDESRLWWNINKREPERKEKENWIKEANEFENSYFERKKEAIKRVNLAINNINRLLSKLWLSTDALDNIEKDIKWVPTFDACGILIWKIEEVCDKSYIPLLEEYRYCVNTAQKDVDLMNIIEESLWFIVFQQSEISKIKKSNEKKNERDNPSPFRTTFFRGDLS